MLDTLIQTLKADIQAIHASNWLGVIDEIGTGGWIQTLLQSCEGASHTLWQGLASYSRQAQVQRYGEATSRSVSQASVNTWAAHNLQTVMPQSGLFFSLVLSGALSSSLQQGDSHCWIALELSDGRRWNWHVRCRQKERLAQQMALGHLGIALLTQLAQSKQIQLKDMDSDLFEQLEIDVWQAQPASDFAQVLDLIDLIEQQASPLVILKPEKGKLHPLRYVDALRSQRLLLHKGSFNPVTCAHLEMIERVLQQNSDYVPVLEISVMNADKGQAEKENLAHRLMMLAHQPYLIALTRTPPLYLSRELFQDHAGAAQVDFICGEDLYQRIFQARYYSDLVGGIDEGLRRLFQAESQLWVCQRQNNTDFPEEAQTQAKRYQDYLQILAMDLPIASSSIRADIQAQLTDWQSQVIEPVAEYIQKQGLYQ